jgi:D-alanyl-D-alanine dipeptidase
MSVLKKSIIPLSLCVFLGVMDVNAYASAPPIVLIASPEVLAVPIKDNREPMIDLNKQSVIALGPSPEIPNNTDYTKMRESVYKKLVKAQSLLPKGLHFCLYEGYRSLQLQKALFDERMTKIRNQHPGWSKEQLFNETIKMVSPVVNLDGTHNIPAHSTGGAIDVYLVNEKGEAVDMGIHPKDWMSDTSGVLSLTNSQEISREAKKNRHIMSHVLEAVGFINYPTEYWHWSYGDRYWAYHQDKPYALYATYKANSLP